MKSRVMLTVVLAASMWTSSAAQPQKERCGTRQPGVEEVAELEQRITRSRSKVKAAETIPVWVHVINKGSGFANGDLSDAMIRIQIRVLNDSFAGRTGGAGSPSSSSSPAPRERRTRTGSSRWRRTSKWSSQAKQIAETRRPRNAEHLYGRRRPVSRLRVLSDDRDLGGVRGPRRRRARLPLVARRLVRDLQRG